MILDYTCQDSIVLEKALAYWLDAGAPTCEHCQSCRKSGWVTK